jgi:hypothetical protein
MGLTCFHRKIYVVLGPGALPDTQGEYKFKTRDQPEGIIIPSRYIFVLNPESCLSNTTESLLMQVGSIALFHRTVLFYTYLDGIV